MKSTLVPLLSTRSVVLLGTMLLALALIVLAIGTSAKQADAATRLVTKTFSKPAQITIPAGSVFAAQGSECTGNTAAGKAAPYPSEKSVGAFPAGSHIRDVNLTLKNYSFNDVPQDVAVLLAHSGKTGATSSPPRHPPRTPARRYLASMGRTPTRSGGSSFEMTRPRTVGSLVGGGA
jgi:hypothetical protein